MSAPGPRLFVSYARSDGKAFAQRLSVRLSQAGFSLWRDLADLEGGRDWWQQIEEAIRAVEYLILVITAAALRSAYVRKEWRFARQEGCCVLPVLADPGLPESETFRALPGWMRRAHFVHADDPEQWTRLLRTLEKPCEVQRVPFMAGDLPADFVARPRELEALVDRLVQGEGNEPVAITGVLQGAGGFGKTVLAQAVCHHPRIQEAFDDGILWVMLGAQPGDMIGRMADLIFEVMGQRSAFDQWQTAATELAKALGERRMLIVIDDVWNAADLKPFLQGGRHCARLVTTRNRATIPAAAATVPVDAMQPEEATALLRTDLPPGEEAALAALARRLGEWPLLLKLVGGQLRERVLTLREPLAKALRWVDRALTKRGLTGFDIENATQRDQAVTETLSASLSLLRESERQRFAELAVFPEDTEVPLAAVETLWAASGGLDDFDSEDLARKLFRISLLLDLDLAKKRLRLHDVIRACLLPLGNEERRALHRSLVEAYREKCRDVWATGPNDGYFFQHLPAHLVESGRSDDLKALLADYDWLAAKLTATDVPSVLADYQRAPDERHLGLIKRALGLSTFALTRDSHHLPSQLLGRLRGVDDRRVQALLEGASAGPGAAWLCPHIASLLPPGPLVQKTFTSHTGPVSALAVLPDGRVVSGSSDNILQVWDVDSGACQKLEGHTGPVSALAVLPDGRVVSGSSDNILQVWDVDSGACQKLEGHTGPVSALAVLPDGRVVSGSDGGVWFRRTYGTLEVWDVDSGTSRMPKGYAVWMTALAVLPDGRVVFGSDDGTLEVWDVDSGACQVREGHAGPVSALAVLPDGRVVSAGSDDDTLRVWDVDSGTSQVLARDTVRALAVLPDGRVVSAGFDDDTLRVWDVGSGASRKLYTGPVRALAVLPDGRVVSGSSDNILRVWDVGSGASQKLEGHTGPVRALAVLPDRRVVSAGSDDDTLRVWDVDSGTSRKLYTGPVSALAVLPDGRVVSGSDGHVVYDSDGRVVSGSYDWTLQVWDVDSGASRKLLVGSREMGRPGSPETGEVSALAVLPDGRVVSGSVEHGAWALSGKWLPLVAGEVEVWDVDSGTSQKLEGHAGPVSALAVLSDERVVFVSANWLLGVWDVCSGTSRVVHRGPVRALAVLPDRRVVSAGSDDGTLRVWDVDSGTSQVLAGHTGPVRALAVLPDGRVVSGSDDGTLRVWDVDSGTSQVLAGHTGPVRALAVLPDGYVVSGSQDGAVILWDLETASSMSAFVGDAAITACVAARVDRLVVGSANGAVHILERRY